MPGALFSYRRNPDGTGSFSYVSPGIARLLGLPEDAGTVEGVRLISLVHPDDQPLVAERFETALGGEQSFHAECRVHHAAKGEIWIETRAVPEREIGGPLLWHGFVVDITRRKLEELARRKAEEALAARERELRTLVENSPDPIIRYDREGRRIYVNPSFERMCGVPAHELLGKTVEEVSVLGTMAGPYKDKLRKALSTGEAVQFEMEWRAPKGTLRWYLIRFHPEIGPDREVASVLVIANDISGFKESARLQYAREREFRTLVENSPDSVVRYNRECRRIYVNKANEDMTGIRVQEHLGRTPEELSALDTASAAAYQQEIEKVLSTGIPHEIVLEWRTGKEEPRCLHTRIVPEHGLDGQVETALCIGRNITDLKAAQKLQHLREREFRTLVENAPDPMIRFDLTGRRIYVNKAQLKLTGLSLAQQIGKTPVELSNLGSVADSYQECIKEAGATGEEFRRIFEWDTPEGVHYWHEVSFVPEHDVSGRVETVLVVVRDITALKQAERLQYEREREFRTLVENAPDPIIRFDRDCRRIYANPALVKLVGFQAEELLGQTPADGRVLKTHAHSYMERIREVLSTGEASQVYLESRAVDGEFHSYQVQLVPEPGPDGCVESVLAVARDVTAIKKAGQRMEEVEAIAGVGYWELDLVRDRCSFSKGACRILECPEGWSPCLADVMLLIPEDQKKGLREAFDTAFAGGLDRVVFEHGVLSRDGDRHLSCHVRIEYGEDGSPVKMTGMIQDISAIKAYQRKLHELAFQDELTGLPNRALFMDRFRQAAAEATRRDQLMGFMLLDLDNFKTINDTYGHMQGDNLLRQVAERLKGALRQSDTVARLGGDEFAVILPGIRDGAHLGVVAGKIAASFAAPFALEVRELFVSCSIGIVLFPTDGRETGELLQYADSAMYHAKAQGKNNYQFYSRELTERSMERARIAEAMRRALSNGEFALHFQPQIDMQSRKLTGAEALLRWDHPKLGMIAPDRFIPIAEETGMIVDIGEWVLRASCEAAGGWNRDGADGMRIAVNLSPRQFMSGNIVESVRAALESSGLSPHRLELEITENLLLEDKDTVRTMLEALHGMGVTIAIDDFGIGYSALSYLTSFPVDTIKIDRSFIHEIATNQDRAELVKAIISMGKSLRCTLVAEGVETREQEKFLKSQGCRLAQGYLYGKPMPADEFESLLVASRS